MKNKTLSKTQQIRNGVVYILPIGLSGLLPLLTIPIFTRILAPADYGVLALSMIYAIFMCGIANSGMSMSFERNYFQYKDNLEKLAQLFYSSLVFVLSNFTLLAVLTFLFKEKISLLLTGSDKHGILILIAFCGNFFLNSANNFYFTYFKNREKANTFTRYRIASTFLNFVLSLFLVALMRVGVIGIVLAQLITGVSIFLLLLYLLLKELPFSLNKSILAESLKISYPLIPGTFIKVINTQFDKYMIGLLATVGGVGIYHIGQRISELIFTFMTAIENVFNPQVYQRMFNQHEQGSESIGRYLTPFLYVSIFVALCVSIFSEELITVLTTVSYHGAIPIVTILSMYMGVLFFGKIIGMQLIYSKKAHITSLLTFLSVGLNVAFNIPMIMKFGAVGAAWATMLAGLISGTIGLVVAQRYYNIKWEYRKIGAIYFIFFTSSILMILSRNLDVVYAIRVLTKSFLVGSYLYLGVKLNIITKENYVLVKNIFPFKSIPLLQR